MANQVNLKKGGGVAVPPPDEVALFAEADGSVKKIDATGAESEIGGGGCGANLPFPESLRICRLGATSNIATLSGPATLDTFTTNDGDFVMLPYQDIKSQNGPWVVNHAGAWTRPSWFNAGEQVEAGVTMVRAMWGLENRFSTWLLVGPVGAVEIGISSLDFRLISCDMTPTDGPLTQGTYARGAFKEIYIVNSNNGPAEVRCLTIGSYAGTVAVIESPGDGVWVGGRGYRALNDPKKWVSLRGSLGVPTVAPANLGLLAGQMATQYDLLNERLIAYITEAGKTGWKVVAEAYAALARGTDLTNADQSLAPGTLKVSEFVQRTALTDNRTKKLLNADVIEGQSVDILRVDTAAFTLTIDADDDTELFVFPASLTKPVRARFRKAETEWEFVDFRYMEATVNV